METTVKERLLKFIKFKELSTHKFDKTSGLSTGYVANIRFSIQPDKIQKIAHKFSELNTGWLLTGEGNMLKDNSEIKHIGAPYYNVDFLAGFDLIFNDQTTIPSYYIDYKPYNGKDVLWCNITGHSMEPEINHGDIIAIREINNWREFLLMGEIYGIITNEFRTIKRLEKGSNKETFRLIPINREYQEQEIPISQIQKIFKVIGCMKKF